MMLLSEASKRLMQYADYMLIFAQVEVVCRTNHSPTILEALTAIFATPYCDRLITTFDP